MGNRSSPLLNSLVDVVNSLYIYTPARHVTDIHPVSFLTQISDSLPAVVFGVIAVAIAFAIQYLPVHVGQVSLLHHVSLSAQKGSSVRFKRNCPRWKFASENNLTKISFGFQTVCHFFFSGRNESHHCCVIATFGPLSDGDVLSLGE